MTRLLAIDQGTTSSRAVLFSLEGEVLGMAQQEFTQYFPQDGWVEHDPEEIWSTIVKVVKELLNTSALSASDVAAIGITNQRETTLVWEKDTGKPIYQAIVWQDRRTAGLCEDLKAEGLEPLVKAKTGLLLDPYFSATKVKWILDQVPGARERASRGELLFGTVDCFLLWRLTGGARHQTTAQHQTTAHKTDASNASRTMLFDIHAQQWDPELLSILDIPAAMLPEVEDCCAEFGSTDPALFGAAIPILGMAGDQQAALVGQGCVSEGMLKSTYGTGCFVMMNTGDQAIVSENNLLTTVGYRLDGKVTYGLEGSIFIAGAAVQWLRDGLKLIDQVSDTEAIAAAHPDPQGVYLVPAFTGLGAPYWDPNARGAILGLTRNSGVADIVTATLLSVCFQTRDLITAMRADGASPRLLRVDGGMVENTWVMEQLANILQIPVDRPVVIETTAWGAACLAGLGAGIFPNLSAIADLWQLDRHFEPTTSPATSDELYRGWQEAVSRVGTRP